MSAASTLAQKTITQQLSVEDELSPYEQKYGKAWASFSPDGSAYKGTWQNNEYREGFGVHVFPNGDIYKGEFHKNLPHGYGKYFSRYTKLPKSKKKQIIMSPEYEPKTYELKYEGQYENGYKHGFGRQYYTPTQFYCGYWEFNLRHGQGVIFYAPETDRDSVLAPKVQEQKAQFVNIEGRPTLVHALRPYGPIFIGQFEKDARQGEGRVIYANGDVFCGYFEENTAQHQGVTYYVERHSKASGEYREGRCMCSTVQTEFSQLDYQLIFETWSHISGGFPGLGLPTAAALQQKFENTWTDLFTPDEAAYPYCHRPMGPEEEQKGARIMQLDAVEVIAKYLPMKMQKDQNEIMKMLHLPLTDHGLTIPVNKLIDPVAVLNQAIVDLNSSSAVGDASGTGLHDSSLQSVEH